VAKNKSRLTNLRIINLCGTLVFLWIAYILATEALVTGNLWKYGGTIILTVLAISRLVKVFVPIKK
jgi:hypothetical protein